MVWAACQAWVLDPNISAVIVSTQSDLGKSAWACKVAWDNSVLDSTDSSVKVGVLDPHNSVLIS